MGEKPRSVPMWVFVVALALAAGILLVGALT